jgi:hypothetical protein
MIHAPHIALLLALIQVESNGDDNAIGDNGTSYGCLQIKAIYVEDVNRILGYKRYTHESAFNRVDAYHMFMLYTNHYATEKRLGRKPTDEDLVRIHNGGPNGWKKSQTKTHWYKVKKLLTK